jgi:predicted deacylase
VIHLSRYLPDRRDLNRSFPGSEQGSLAARVAHIFNEQIVSRCTHGIDLHTGAIHRANLDDAQVEQMANAFGAPVVLNAALRAGSRRPGQEGPTARPHQRPLSHHDHRHPITLRRHHHRPGADTGHARG